MIGVLYALFGLRKKSCNMPLIKKYSKCSLFYQFGDPAHVSDGLFGPNGLTAVWANSGIITPEQTAAVVPEKA